LMIESLRLGRCCCCRWTATTISERASS
jgi:hypothetical protein